MRKIKFYPAFRVSNIVVWKIINEHHILSSKGECIQTVALENFSDTEAIAHVKDNLFAIVNVQQMTIVLATIDTRTRSIDAERLPMIRVGDEIDTNDGIEGLTYDPATNSFFSVKEKSPKRIYQIRMENGPNPVEEMTRWHMKLEHLGNCRFMVTG